jgi:hypothetical protein
VENGPSHQLRARAYIGYYMAKPELRYGALPDCLRYPEHSLEAATFCYDDVIRTRLGTSRLAGGL